MAQLTLLTIEPLEAQRGVASLEKSSINASPTYMAAWATFRNFTHSSEEKHVCESLRHGVTTHNWFVHYLWDIYGGFGHNGKIIQRTLPSHTQPSRSDLAAWATF